MKRKTTVGQTKKMRNGMTATIIMYRAVDDIDVRFDNGTIVHGVTYRDFSDGNVAPREGEQS